MNTQSGMATFLMRNIVGVGNRGPSQLAILNANGCKMINSATPWNNDYGNPTIVRASNDRGRGTLIICECLDPGDAAFIVRTSNAHDDMLTALKESHRALLHYEWYAQDASSARAANEAAIAKAEVRS